MGGNALKSLGVETRRMDAPEFHQVSADIIKAFSLAFPGVRVEAIPAYRSKSDFGDLDLMVEKERFNAIGGVEFLEEWAARTGFSRGSHRNDTVTSVEWRSHPGEEKGLQVDFITSPAEEFNSALAYFSYNDLGNLMGRIAHKMGLVYGHRGLLFTMRDNTHAFDNIVVSHDMDKSMSFLGYDPVRFRSGFEDLEDIYQFVVSSQYFNRDIYLLENRNHVSRTRDRKRKTYRGFLEWIEPRNDLPAYQYPEEKSHWVPIIEGAFPSFAGDYAKSLERLASREFVAENFNGRIVSDMTGLKDEDLGRAMRFIHQSMSFDEIESCLREKGVEGMKGVIAQAVAASKRSHRP